MDEMSKNVIKGRSSGIADVRYSPSAVLRCGSKGPSPEQIGPVVAEISYDYTPAAS